MATKALQAKLSNKKIKVRTFEQFVSAIGRVAEGKLDTQQIEITSKTMTVDVKIDGPSWDQRIDYRGAQYVQNVQKQVNELYKRYPKYLPGEVPIIKVRVRKGSNLLSPELIDIAKHALTIMGPTNITISIITALVCATGYAIYFRHTRSIEAARPFDLAQRAIHAMLEIARSTGIDPNKAEKPITELTKSLEDFDTLKIGKEQPITGFVARQLTKLKQPRRVRESYPCDGAYLLCKINLTQPKHSLILELEQDGKPINAYTEHLPDSVTKILLDLVSEKRSHNQLPFPIELQIDVYCTKKKITYGSILAIGKPRSGMTHWSLKELPPKEQILPLLSYAITSVGTRPPGIE